MPEKKSVGKGSFHVFPRENIATSHLAWLVRKWKRKKKKKGRGFFIFGHVALLIYTIRVDNKMSLKKKYERINKEVENVLSFLKKLINFFLIHNVLKIGLD